MTSAAADAGSNGIVRPARPEDAPRMARIQVDTWRLAYKTVLPASVLAELTVEDASAAWNAAVSHPPTAEHHVLVAVDTATDTVVGFAALTPAGDDDTDPHTDAEIALLLVDAAHVHMGHGSRLLAASVDVWRASKVTRALAWVVEQDQALHGLLVSAGWGDDGSHRTLDAADGSEPLRQLRLHTDLRDG